MHYLRVCCWAFGALLIYGCRAATDRALPTRLETTHGPLNERLAKMVEADSLALSPLEADRLTGAVFLDARETDEYLTSHLPGAIFLGFNRPDYTALAGLDPTTPLVVYCTVGYRSERIAERLRERGFSKVYNLYGSLYAWRLAGFPLVNAKGNTDDIHTFNRKWGRFIPDTLGNKVY